MQFGTVESAYSSRTDDGIIAICHKKKEEGRRKKEEGSSATSNVRDVTDGIRKKEKEGRRKNA
ncbi:hypothetical protein IQ269_20295 [Tychonema sp. LEGE 07199]|uniref:hypothetical protein n=1 Tax=unclassified Tychonema TaxID=2642144 RepID=UPI00187E7673|nr:MULTISPECIES: hypothetical protein [unclassified Tychonema]MBE9123074.1 hypothetical protein [Tychonema sp. LEGE 07199]MBE9132790.1 hypothetical protein [Tychonema sp. LEGE 07196]